MVPILNVHGSGGRAKISQVVQAHILRSCNRDLEILRSVNHASPLRPCSEIHLPCCDAREDQRSRRKSRPGNRTGLTQTGAQSILDFIFNGFYLQCCRGGASKISQVVQVHILRSCNQHLEILTSGNHASSLRPCSDRYIFHAAI